MTLLKFHRSLWKGNLTALLLWMSYGSCQFSLYARSRELLAPAKATVLSHNLFSVPVVNVVSDGLAGAIACCGSTLLTYPFDIARTQFAIQVSKYFLLLTLLMRIIGEYQSPRTYRLLCGGHFVENWDFW